MFIVLRDDRRGRSASEAGRSLLAQGGDAFQMVGGADAERLVSDAGVHHSMGDTLEFEIGEQLVQRIA